MRLGDFSKLEANLLNPCFDSLEPFYRSVLRRSVAGWTLSSCQREELSERIRFEHLRHVHSYMPGAIAADGEVHFYGFKAYLEQRVPYIAAAHFRMMLAVARRQELLDEKLDFLPDAGTEIRFDKASVRDAVFLTFAGRLIEPHWPADSQPHALKCVEGRVPISRWILKTETPDSMLMWGHYCSAHRGIVIGFNRSWVWFQGPKGLRPVTYVRDRVIWDTSVKPGSVKEFQTAKQMVFSKNADWAYEKELRQMFLLKGLRKRALPDGRAGHFLPLKPEAIKSVVLGLRCSKETENTVRTALVRSGLSHVSVRRAVLHVSKFAVNFVPA